MENLVAPLCFRLWPSQKIDYLLLLVGSWIDPMKMDI
jgi:hypothetical protein